VTPPAYLNRRCRTVQSHICPLTFSRALPVRPTRAGCESRCGIKAGMGIASRAIALRGLDGDRLGL
jgi:hypothetical protein